DMGMREKMPAGLKFALRMKTKLEVVDDGFKWRKYGKKVVKSSPHPRNYFKCSVIGCNVKKRIQRDVKDSRYVITTYDGVHNHKGLASASASALLCVASPASTKCFGSAWFRMIFPGYTSALQIADAFWFGSALLYAPVRIATD
nr:probable WRKY transcription factor 51 [Tanacetum cinerariifolium]GEY34519.1 probable WRKY transcription factor 51 [Tanacetum cinerariifolium]